MRNAAVNNPTKDGISSVDLVSALSNYTPDEQYLGGVDTIIRRRVGHYDRELEEFWLKRALTKGEDPNDWDILLLVKEHRLVGNNWYKTMLQNRKTKKYSGRSFALFVGGDELYFTKKLGQKRPPADLAVNTEWFVEWTKLLVDKAFWIQLKSQVIKKEEAAADAAERKQKEEETADAAERKQKEEEAALKISECTGEDEGDGGGGEGEGETKGETKKGNGGGGRGLSFADEEEIQMLRLQRLTAENLPVVVDGEVAWQGEDSSSSLSSSKKSLTGGGAERKQKEEAAERKQKEEEAAERKQKEEEARTVAQDGCVLQ